MADIAYESQTLQTVTYANSSVMTKPTGTTANDILMFVIQKENNDAITAPSGFTLDDSTIVGYGTETLYLYTKRCGDSEPADYTFSWTNATVVQSCLMRFGGVALSGTVYDTSIVKNSGGYDTSAVALSVTTATDNAMIIAIAGCAPSRNYTAPGGMTEVFDDTGTTLAYVLQEAAGASGNKTFTADGATSWVTMCFALRPITYTVTYDGNDNDSGTAPATQYKTPEVDLTLATNTGSLARTGYIFDGWNTAADGSGTDYAEGATYSTDADVTLYTKWIDMYDIDYDGNSNTSGTAPAKQYKAPTVDLTLATNSGNLAKTGHIFSRWNTAADGSGDDYVEGATYSTDADATMYATYTPIYAVTYDGNGNTYGTVPESQTKIEDVILELRSNTGGLLKAGYYFDGWNTNASGTGTDYAEGAFYSANEAVTMYAKWVITCECLNLTSTNYIRKEIDKPTTADWVLSFWAETKSVAEHAKTVQFYCHTWVDEDLDVEANPTVSVILVANADGDLELGITSLEPNCPGCDRISINTTVPSNALGWHHYVVKHTGGVSGLIDAWQDGVDVDWGEVSPYIGPEAAWSGVVNINRGGGHVYNPRWYDGDDAIEALQGYYYTDVLAGGDKVLPPA